MENTKEQQRKVAEAHNFMQHLESCSHQITH